MWISFLDVDAVDAELHNILTMPVLPLGMVFTALLLEDDDLIAARLAEDRRHDRSALNRRVPGFRLVAADHQHVAERNFALLGSAENITLDLETISNGHTILLSTGTNDGVHDKSSK